MQVPIKAWNNIKTRTQKGIITGTEILNLGKIEQLDAVICQPKRVQSSAFQLTQDV